MVMGSICLSIIDLQFSWYCQLVLPISIANFVNKNSWYDLIKIDT